ncbi:glycerol-3-phosphate 1-O-acyltransferase PlsB [Parashewanella spongiae]|uniref:Glycerol-3-phosphate acyltransferase n=1 Tax=Parashewanella spongiae TaxID=342950 RepID=A0A3A6U0U7_9GAMM|nr:glycerol-3-phosphate 1-O-acyltransferase PlsB [Parashewanella spongiae]MCL1077874.1 glycerol-3-phosphate 1-O-acyltransferase PlsB [Parashewanella spongiae]RJY17606.1 glycerol-3-phosphate 1-O-acyltransferase PlsB [Parashewanella spongiae]
MGKHNSWFFKLLRLLQKWFVHSVIVPQNPFSDLNLQADKPVVYVMKTESVSDIAVLSQTAQELGLPSPYDSIRIAGTTLPRVVCLESAKPLFRNKPSSNRFLIPFQNLLKFHQQDAELDIQLLPVSVYWGRVPGKEQDTMKAAVLERESPTWLRKCLMILFLGRHNFIQFSNTVSLADMAKQHGTDQAIAHKLSRVARVHFRRQRKVMTGPDLPNRQTLFRQLLKSPTIVKAIAEEANSKKITEEQAKKKAESYLNEIAANYSDSLVRIAERFLTWLWNKLYKGINIKGAESVRKLHHDGHEIVYVPCHRSHMDYLLLSYILYYQGMVPPHIAAGINLNFWPAGPMFRKGGAFFIRRSFRGNKLYTAVFRSYLDQLFTKGYSVEYFTEGGRSRTGRLLAPKTGMLAMTINSVLRGIERPVTLVPVYLGYDHVMEVSTYHKELSGKKKQKESVWQVFSALRKLGNFGQGYVNFGEPINIQQYLSANAPQWREEMALDTEQKPKWLTPVVNGLANQVMTGINGAAAASSVTLISLILLAAKQNSLERPMLEKQLALYLKLLVTVPYTEFTSVPEGDAKLLLEQGLELNKFTIESDPLGDIISLDEKQARNMTYYRNNIVHLLILPSLIARCILRLESCCFDKVYRVIQQQYPLLQAELYLQIESLDVYVQNMINLFIEQQLITTSQQGDTEHLVIQSDGASQLELLAETTSEMQQRYAIIFNLLALQPDIERADLERESHQLAKHIGSLHGIAAPEFYDKKLYATLTVKLKDMGLLGQQQQAQVDDIGQQLNQLLDPSLKQTLINGVHQTQRVEQGLLN